MATMTRASLCTGKESGGCSGHVTVTRFANTVPCTAATGIVKLNVTTADSPGAMTGIVPSVPVSESLTMTFVAGLLPVFVTSIV